MTRYAAISSAGHRHTSDSRTEIDAWCAERVKRGESCEVYAKGLPPFGRGGPQAAVEQVGKWRAANG